MTRIEKFKFYREEITKLSNLSYYITLDNEKLKEYENKIKKINPSILQMIEPKENPIISVDIDIKGSENKIPTKIINLFTDLNNAKNSIAKENIYHFIHDIKNNDILNENGTIKDDWLNKNNQFVAIKTINTTTHELNMNDTNFQQSLQLSMHEFKFNTNEINNVCHTTNLFKNIKYSKYIPIIFLIAFLIVIISIILIFIFLAIGMVI
jgi:hypothetical protein